MKGVMAIYDDDIRYAGQLARACGQKGRLPFACVHFTDFSELVEYMKQHPVCMLLLGEKQSLHLDIPKGLPVILLSETAGPKAQSEQMLVYKYQALDKLIREILAGYQQTQTAAGAAAGDGQSRLAGVYSPVNGCLKTSFALTLGQVLSKEEKVLFISLEDNSAFRKMLCPEAGGDFSDVIYYFHQQKLDFSTIQPFIYTWEQLDYIQPVRYPEDLCQITASQMKELLTKLCKTGFYKTVIVDFGSYGKTVLPLLSLCQGVYMPVKKDVLSQGKVEAFEAYALQAGYGSLLQKLQKLNLPPISQRDSGSYLEQLVWSELGDYVRSMVKGGIA